MADGRGFGDNTGSGILDQLDFMEEFVGETKQMAVAIVQAGSDQRVDQDSGAVWSE